MWSHMGEGMGGWGWGWMIFGGLHMLLFWALVIGVIVLVVRVLSDGASGKRHDKDALAILKERYARGEIDKAEYERMREDLRR
jgi:putative membrane protein